MTQTGELTIDHSDGGAEVGRPRVLVLAYPELARAVSAALGCEPDAAERGTPACVCVGARTLDELFEQVFPPSAAKEPGAGGALLTTLKSGFGLMLDVLRRAAGGRRPTAAETAAAPKRHAATPASFFEWGDFDFVIIQDLWASGGGRETLEAAGYELTRFDYYVRGNFNTKKIVLVTDGSFLLDGADNGQAWKTRDLQALVTAAFDQKNAIALVDLKSRDTGGRLRDLVAGRPDTEKSAPHPGAPALADGDGLPRVCALRGRVGVAIAKALRLYIRARAEVIVIDDERQELEKTFEEVTGVPLLGDDGGARRGVMVAARTHSSSEADFDDLLKLCLQRFEEALQGGKDYVLFVTDILFKLPEWEKTGIDLIEGLRRRLAAGPESRRCGIVAFTGFTTPFIAMSAYQRGADFVVPKGARGSHDLSTAETDFLLMTLASLCFQKSFLRDMRCAARRLMGSATRPELFSWTLRRLRAVLPQHAVSLHLQQEWLDTCYLLEALTLYEPGGAQAEQIFREVSSKYD